MCGVILILGMLCQYRFMMQRFIYFIFLALFILSCEPRSTQLFSKLDASHTGVDFKNKLTETHTYNYFTYPYMYLGGGVSIGDVNNDGLEDIFI